MILIEGKEQFDIDGKCAVTIGKFDGVHKGHKLLMEKILAKKSEGLLATVFTFDPSPAVFFGSKEKELMTREEKRRFFAAAGIDVLVEYPMNRKSASVDPELFVRDILVGQMHAAYIAAGSDLSYGNRGAGDFALLQRLAPELRYTAEMVRKKKRRGEEIGSTLVRHLVEMGDLAEAKACLGVPYGILTRSEADGKIIVSDRKLLPPVGEYPVRVFSADSYFEGNKNIHGHRDTLCIEMNAVCLCGHKDVDRDIYVTFEV